MKRILLVAFLTVATGLFAQDINALLGQADNLHEDKDYDAVYEVLKKAEVVTPDDFEVIWRLSRAHFDFYDNSDDEAYSNEQIYKAFDYAKEALDMNPNRAESHKWYAICIGQVGIIEGTKQKILNSYHVRDHTLKAIELDPEDDGNYHVMGRWHYTLADLSWFERQIASLIYAKPPKASFEEARDFFKQAIELDPDDIRNYVWLGKTFEELDDEDSAKKAYEKALALTPESESDRILQDEARELMDNL